MLAEVFAGVIDATVAACQEIYESRLQGVVVFGSVARSATVGADRPRAPE
jgi:hypothetical protein